MIACLSQASAWALRGVTVMETTFVHPAFKRAVALTGALREHFPKSVEEAQAFEPMIRIRALSSRVLVVENVRGAQKWVGRSRWNFGSFHLWGDVPALMPMTKKAIKVPTMGSGWYPPEHPKHTPGLAFNGHADRIVRDGQKVPTDRICDCGHRESEHGINGFDIDLPCSKSGSKSPARKAASAMIAKIPFVLASWIAKSYYPAEAEQRAV